MIKSYLRIAWRNLMKNRIYAAINILGLAIGISFCAIIYLITSFQFSFNKSYPDEKRIYRVVSDMYSPQFGYNYSSGIPDPAPVAMRSEITGLEAIAVFHNYNAKAAVNDGSIGYKEFDAADERGGKSDIIIADPGYFNIFKHQWLAGNEATALKEPFTVILTESKAYYYFGKNEPNEMLGKIITYDDSLQVTVSGIIADPPKNTDFRFGDFISFSTITNSFLNSKFHLYQWDDNRYAQTFVKIAPAISYSKISRQLVDFVKRHVVTKAGDKEQYKLQPLSDLHFNQNYDDPYSVKSHLPTLYGLIIIAMFILIVAVINFINLSTVISVNRAKEVGIRKLCGSKRISLVFQFMAETFIVTFIALVLSLGGLKFLLIALESLIPNAGDLQVFSASTLLFLLYITVFTTLLAGFYPAKILSSYMPAHVLKGSSNQIRKKGGSLRKGLIVFQFTTSLVFIICAIVVRNQMWFVLNKDLGFSKDAVITIRTNPAYPIHKKNVLAERIRHLSGVKMVSVSEGTPLAKEHWHNPLVYKGQHETGASCLLEWADDQYLSLYGIKLIAGRNLERSDTAKELLINQSCAKALGFPNPQDAINKFAETMIPGKGFRSLPIVGVMADFHTESLHTAISPFIISTSDEFGRDLNIKLFTNGNSILSFKKVISEIETVWKEVYPNKGFEFSFFDNAIANLYGKEQKTAGLINIAMGLAIFISCIGLFGLAAFTVQQRAKEISIRKVIGASIGNIIVMLSKDIIVLVVVSIAIASPIGWYLMNRWLEGFAYKVNVSLWIFAMAAIITIVIAFATVSFQVIKAAISNPVKNMRAD